MRMNRTIIRSPVTDNPPACRVSPEHVCLHVLVGVGVALGDEGDGHPQVRSLQNQILRRQTSVPPVDPEAQSQVLSVTQHLVPQKLLCDARKKKKHSWRHKVWQSYFGVIRGFVYSDLVLRLSLKSKVLLRWRSDLLVDSGPSCSQQTLILTNPNTEQLRQQKHSETSSNCFYVWFWDGGDETLRPTSRTDVFSPRGVVWRTYWPGLVCSTWPAHRLCRETCNAFW